MRHPVRLGGRFPFAVGVPTRLNRTIASVTTSEATAGPGAVRDRPDVFISYAREDQGFVGRLTAGLAELGQDVWIDVEDIRGGASDWRANVWAGIEAAKAMVFVLTPDSLASSVCGEECRRAVELNKRIIPVLLRSVDGLEVPPALGRPNWIHATAEDRFDASVAALVAALELDEAWVEQHARFTQRTGEWLRNDRDRSYLLSGSDLRSAERWLDDQDGHREAPTSDQVAYITAGRRAAARRQRQLLAGTGLALMVTTALAIISLVLRSTAVDRERTARAQAAAAQSIAALSRDNVESVRRALDAVAIRADEPEVRYALLRAVGAAGWTSLLRIADPRPGVKAAPLLDVEFADDGSRVATASADGKAAVWNTRTGRRVTLVGHKRSVNTIVFSPDGRRVVTASRDGTARTWDSSSGRPVHVLDTKDHDLAFATYGAGGRLVITAGRRRAQLWDAASGARVWQLPSRGEPLAIRLSLDGRRALTPAGTGGGAWLWDVAGRRRVAKLPGTGLGTLTFALFSGDSHRISTLDPGGAVTVWAAGDGRRVASLRRRRTSVTDTDLSDDGRRVVTAGADGRAVVSDVASRRTIAVLANSESLVSAQFDHGGRYVVTGDDGGVARVWSVADERAVAVLRGHTAAVHLARFSPDSRRVATASDDGTALLWPAQAQTPADPRWHHADGTTFSPDSRHVLVVAGGRGAVWDTATGTTVALAGGVYPSVSLAWACGRATGCSPWSPDGRVVAGADAHGHAVLWNARTGAVQRRIGQGSGFAIGAAFSPDGRRVAVVRASRPAAEVWNLRGNRLEARVPSGRSRRGDLYSAQFVANPLRILTVDSSEVAQLSDPATGSSAVLRGETLPVAVAASGDGQQLAIGTTGGQLRVFSGQGAAMGTRQAAYDERVSSVAFDQAGTLIATGGQKGTTRIWDARTLASTTLQAPGGEISGATFSRGGNLVLITSGSRSRLWDRSLRRVVLDLPRTPAARAELSPDGSRLVLAGADRLEARRCDACTPLDELVRRARSLLAAR